MDFLRKTCIHTNIQPLPGKYRYSMNFVFEQKGVQNTTCFIFEHVVYGRFYIVVARTLFALFLDKLFDFTGTERFSIFLSMNFCHDIHIKRRGRGGGELLVRVIESANLFHRKYLLLRGSHRKYFDNFLCKLMSMIENRIAFSEFWNVTLFLLYICCKFF